MAYTDIKVMVNEYIRRKWQQLWKSNRENKLFQIKLALGSGRGTRTQKLKRRGNLNLTIHWSYTADPCLYAKTGGMAEIYMA